MNVHWRLLLTCIMYTIFGASTHFQYGLYNLIDSEVKSFINSSIYNNYQKIITVYQLEWLYSVLSASLFIGYPISCIFLSYVMEKFGRKGGTVFIKNPIVIIGCLFSFVGAYCDRFELLYIGRFLNGFAMPMTMFDNIFLTECAPVTSRAFVGILPSIGLVCMTVFGQTMGLDRFLGTVNLWPFLFLIPVLFSCIHFVLAAFLPESPRHLYFTLNNEMKARRSLHFYHGNEAHIDLIIAEYDEEMQRIEVEETAAGLGKILKTKCLRWPLVIYVVICLTSTFDGKLNGFVAGRLVFSVIPVSFIVSGLVFADFYSMTILSLVVSANEAALYSILFVQLPSILPMIVGLTLIANKGRRPLLLIGFGLALSGTALVAASSITSSVGFLAVIGLILITTGHSFGPTLVRRFIAAELCPQIGRSKTVSFGTFLDTIVTLVLLSIYSPMTHQFGNSIMSMFTICGVICFIFLFKYFPETRNKTVTENISQWLPEVLQNIDEKTPLVSKTEL